MWKCYYYYDNNEHDNEHDNDVIPDGYLCQ